MTEDICGYVIRDDVSKRYYNGRSVTESKLSKVRARYERVIGAQKEVTRLQSQGYPNPENLVIVPIAVVTLESIKPKITKQKTGFVIQIVESVPKDAWNPAWKRVSFYKGNKAKLPETVDQKIARQLAVDKAKLYGNFNEPYRVNERLQNALWLAYYDWTGHGSRVVTKVRATIFPSREAAQRHLDVFNANLDRFGKEFGPTNSNKHLDFETEAPSQSFETERARNKVSIVEVK